MRTADTLKAISFNVDGTLWDFDSAARSALGRVLAELERLDPKPAKVLDVATVVEIRDRAHDELRGVVTDLNEIRRESFRHVLREVGRPDDALAARLADLYFRHKNARMRLFDDVRPTLLALSPLYSLGIVSNGNSYPEHLGLENLMTFHVYAQDHGGIEKPDPRIFKIALEKAGCEPHEMLHVGDSLETDVAGAKAAGVSSVWLDRNGDARDPNVDEEPEWEIRSLREMARIL